MRSFFFIFVAGLLFGSNAQSQTQPNGTTTTSGLSVRPAGPTPNRRQELYDQYHGITKKPASPAPAAPVDNQTRPIAPQPVSSAPVRQAEPQQPILLDGSMSGVRIGVRGGITRLIYIDEAAGSNPTLGFVGGFAFHFGRGAVSFQPELNYARYAVKSREPFGSQTLNIATDRFEVPLLLKIASGSTSSTRFFLNVGPYGAYTSSASLNSQKISLDRATGRFSFGAAAGLGVALKTGPGHLTLELRGLYELGDVDNGVGTDTKTILSQATVGYMIPLGGSR